MDTSVDNKRAELIESYAGKAADVTRRLFTQAFTVTDSAKSLLAKPRAAFESARSAATSLFNRSSAEAATSEAASAEQPAAAQ